MAIINGEGGAEKEGTFQQFPDSKSKVGERAFHFILEMFTRSLAFSNVINGKIN